MNNSSAADPEETKRAGSESNTGAGRYGDTDPAVWGWRRPSREELQAERLDKLERELAIPPVPPS